MHIGSGLQRLHQPTRSRLPRNNDFAFFPSPKQTFTCSKIQFALFLIGVMAREAIGLE